MDRQLLALFLFRGLFLLFITTSASPQAVKTSCGDKQVAGVSHKADLPVSLVRQPIAAPLQREVFEDAGRRESGRRNWPRRIKASEREPLPLPAVLLFRSFGLCFIFAVYYCDELSYTM